MAPHLRHGEARPMDVIDLLPNDVGSDVGDLAAIGELVVCAEGGES